MFSHTLIKTERNGQQDKCSYQREFVDMLSIILVLTLLSGICFLVHINNGGIIIFPRIL